MKQTAFLIIFFTFITAVNIHSQERYDDQAELSTQNNEYGQEQNIIAEQSNNSPENTQAQKLAVHQEQNGSETVKQEQPSVVSQSQVQTKTVQQTQTVQQFTVGIQNITPLTLELVNLIQSSGKSLNELYYFISKPFTMVISEQYDVPGIEIQNGTLIMPDRSQSSTIVFNGNQAGRLHEFPVSGSADIFEVVFKIGSRDIALKFRKNQQNFFELFSAVIDTRPYMLHSDTELPQLAISSNISSGGERVQAFPSAQAGGRSGYVEGRGSLERNKIIAYIKSQNSSLKESDIEKLIGAYIEEAAFENINHDIAIAQMLHATNFLKNRRRVSSHNYAGLIELPNWNGRFASMTEGVRAHIQHIKGYSGAAMNRQQIVDPRYNVLVNLKYSGTVKTFDQLYERWTANPENYKKNIEKILDGLFLYNQR